MVELVGGVPPLASVVVPAHNEERSIGRLLEAIAPSQGAQRFEVIVVCNGCTDRTADVARSFNVRVLDLKEPGKSNALLEGERAAAGRFRIYLDADVEISANSVEALISAVQSGPFLAAGPSRVVPRDGVQRLVGWYYDVWEMLPSVREGLFGRGVIALSESGVQRVRALPPSMSDDLAISEAFTSEERIVVDTATVVVHPPRTLRDLVLRRSRIATGNAQADQSSLRTSSARTGVRTLGSILRRHPLSAGKLVVFVAVVAAGRLRARRSIAVGDFRTWERDESSRSQLG